MSDDNYIMSSVGGTPFFSIIIPLYNKQYTIANTIRNILTQSFTDYEIIVVDDGSTDNSVDEVLKINDFRIRLLEKKNGGPSSARNYGLDNARGKYGYFIDADDELLTDSLQLMYEVVSSHPTFFVFSFNYYVCIPSQSIREIFSSHYCSGRVRHPFFHWILRNFHPCPGAFVFRISEFHHYRFNERYHRREDDEFLYRVIKEFEFYASPIPIFAYNQDSLSASKPRINWREDYICNLVLSGKTFFERLCLYHLYLEACRLYPEIVNDIYGKSFCKLSYRIAYSIAMRFLSYRWRWDQIRLMQ